jgi:hypothetical protein
MQILTIRGGITNVLRYIEPRGCSIRPSDFFLFGYLKEKLIDFDCRSRENLKSTITSIFNEIAEETLAAVFVSCMEPFKWVIRNKGRYYYK